MVNLARVSGLILCLLAAGCGRPDANVEFAAAMAAAREGTSKGWEEAASRAERAMAAGGNASALRGLHVLALHRSGRLEAATTQAQTIARDFPDSYLCQFVAGKVLFEAGNAMDALTPLRTAARLKPDNKDCQTLLARCAARQKVDDVEAAFTALMDGPQGHLATNSLGIYQVGQGRYPEAMSMFSQTAARTDHPAPYLNMAVLCDQYMKKPDLARRYYVKYLLEAGDRFPDRSEAVQGRLRQLAARE